MHKTKMQQADYMGKLETLSGADAFNLTQMQKSPCICFNPKCEFYVVLPSAIPVTAASIVVMDHNGKKRHVKRYSYKFGMGSTAFYAYFCEVCHNVLELVGADAQLKSMPTEQYHLLKF